MDIVCHNKIRFDLIKRNLYRNSSNRVLKAYTVSHTV